jgi:dolichyl-phosphate beta-glucosyltransferase
MYLSIVLPAWNEAIKIADDIGELAQYSKDINFSIELIIVDDGSDDHTAQLVEEVTVPDSLEIRAISYTPHRGKGYAVRKGISESCGDYVMFMDSGQNVPVKFVNSGLKLIEQKECDILIGSRYLPESVIKKRLIWYRRIISNMFRIFVKWYLTIPVFLTDTQCGFKFFRGDIARELFKQSMSDGFIFDLEIILLATEKNYKICEFPIEWTCDRDSRLSLIRSFIPIFREIRRLKLRF